MRLSAYQSSTAIACSSGWASSSSTAAYDGSLRYASAAGATARFRFTGRDVAWIARKGATSGQARVYVDGVLVSTVDLYSATARARVVVFRKAWSVAGTHTIEIRVVGTKGRARVELDGFAVVK